MSEDLLPTPKDSKNKNPETSSEKSILRQMFSHFKEREKTPPDLKEKILVGKISPQSPEYTQLKKHCNPLELEMGIITREALLKAGFVFNNHIGGGEKPIINAVINGIDFGTRSLLTEGELKMIKDLQLLSLDSETLDSIRFDMFSLLMASTVEPPFLSIGNLINHLPVGKIGWKTGTSAQWDLVDRYWRHQLSQIKTEQGDNPTLSFVEKPFLIKFFQDHNIYLPERSAEDAFYKKTRDKTVSAISQRHQKVAGFTSPFLDSGFHFDVNPDLGFSIPHLARVNIVVLHLASRGLSEMGSSRNGSHDQRYMSIPEYKDNIYPQDPTQREKIHAEEAAHYATKDKKQEILLAIQTEMIKMAKEWEKQNFPKKQTPFSRLRNFIHRK